MPRDSFLVAVGQQIRKKRQDAGLSQIDLHNKTGVPQHALSEIEGGRRAANLRTLAKIAEGLDVQPRDLIPTVKR